MNTIERSFSRWSQKQQIEFLERMLQEIPVCIRLVWSIEKSTETEKVEKVKQWLELAPLVAKQLRAAKKQKDLSASDRLGAKLDAWLSAHPAIQELLERALSSNVARVNKCKSELSTQPTAASRPR